MYGLHASDLDEFKIKREAVFEFVQNPQVIRKGDQVTISFETKGFCDVTIAIENSEGRIVRHLASGVLGDRAPKPFQQRTKKQQIVWDGKDDQGLYLDHKNALRVRVSLGLKPVFEKNLYWSPYKRISQSPPRIEATEEGVFVYEGAGIDAIRQYDHEGRYQRTVYPFPADKLESVKGLDWKNFPQGKRRPLKKSMYQQTLLTSGDNASIYNRRGQTGRAATAMAVRDKKVALAHLKLNRLATDGSSGEMTLEGGKTSATVSPFRIGGSKPAGTADIGPTSAAISPDGKWLYLAGYAYNLYVNSGCLHGVMRMPLGGEGDAKPFVGKISAQNRMAGGFGTKPGEFRGASSVACDSVGRVYVSDYLNDRVQVFSSDGEFLKAIDIFRPALVRINAKNNEIVVFSWRIPSNHSVPDQDANSLTQEIQPKMARFKSFEDPKKISQLDLPLPARDNRDRILPYALYTWAEIDPWAKNFTVWLGVECLNNLEAGVHGGDGGRSTRWEKSGIRLLQEREGKLEVVRDFGTLTRDEVVRAKPPTNAIQRCYVNPVTGKLYLAEADSAPTIKSSRKWLEIDPETGRIEVLDLPFNTMEGAFDLDGLAYLRSTNVIARYDPKTWREVPWDYGEERIRVGDNVFRKETALISGLILPSKPPVCFHQGGIFVSPKGHVVASCAYRFEGISKSHFLTREKKVHKSMAYKPALYPGRVSNSTSPCIHVWDKHGKLVYEDAVPGVGQVDGIAMDRDDNLYFMHTPTRVLDGNPYFDILSETLTKVAPMRAKFISASKCPIPLSPGDRPKHKQAVKDMWVENAEWFYGGVGFAGFNNPHADGGCACWFSRFTLDLFARSITPEPNYFSVAVLDSEGNLITRIGTPGNVDSAGSKSAVPLEGDGVSLFYACYVGTHSDRRIFISDHGNGRIVSVKVDYHRDHYVALKRQ